MGSKHQLFYVDLKLRNQFNTLVSDAEHVYRRNTASAYFTMHVVKRYDSNNEVEHTDIIIDASRRNFGQKYHRITEQLATELTLIPREARWAYLQEIINEPTT